MKIACTVWDEVIYIIDMTYFTIWSKTP